MEIPPDAENASLSLRKIKKKESKRESRGTRLPPDWRPSVKNIEEAKAEGLTDRDIERTSKIFPDYWRQQPGQKGVKLDWDATWRNWCRREADRLGRTPPSAALSVEAGFYAAAESDELAAWDRHKIDTEGKKCPRDRNGGWRVPLRWPPGHEPRANGELRVAGGAA